MFYVRRPEQNQLPVIRVATAEEFYKYKKRTTFTDAVDDSKNTLASSLDMVQKSPVNKLSEDVPLIINCEL